jgi:hypothetical protein
MFPSLPPGYLPLPPGCLPLPPGCLPLPLERLTNHFLIHVRIGRKGCEGWRDAGVGCVQALCALAPFEVDALHVFALMTIPHVSVPALFAAHATQGGV